MTDIEESQPEEPYVKVPLSLLRLVKAKVIKPADAWLFVIQMMHVNSERAQAGDTNVWPSRETMAEWMGFADTRDGVRGVDKHVTRLEDAKLVKKTKRRRGRMISRNLYTLDIPSSARSVEKRTTPRPAKTPEADVSPAQPVVHESAHRCVGTCTCVVHESAPELEEVELEEEDQNLSPLEAETDAPAEPVIRAPEERERSSPPPKINPDQLTAAYEELAKLDVDTAEANQLIPLILQSLTRKPEGPAWWRTVGKNPDLARMVTAARREAAKAEERRAAQEAADALRRATIVQQRAEGPPRATVPPATAKELLQRQWAINRQKAADAREADDKRRAELDALLAGMGGKDDHEPTEVSQ